RPLLLSPCSGREHTAHARRRDYGVTYPHLTTEFYPGAHVPPRVDRVGHDPSAPVPHPLPAPALYTISGRTPATKCRRQESSRKTSVAHNWPRPNQIRP